MIKQKVLEKYPDIFFWECNGCKRLYTNEHLRKKCTTFGCGRYLTTNTTKRRFVRLEAIDFTLDEVIKLIEDEENPYPLDLLKKPLTEEGKHWEFGHKVFENTKVNIGNLVIKYLKILKKSLSQ